MLIILKLRLIFLLFLLISFDLYSKQYVCVTNICISGNNITKNNVILRELPFKLGDTIGIDKMERSLKMARNNLLNLSLFNYVSISESVNEEKPENFDTIINNIEVSIIVEERWYIWPLISFTFEDRNLSSWLKEADGDKITVDAGIILYNAWGLNHNLMASYKFGYQKGFSIKYDNFAIGNSKKHIVSFGLYGQFSKTENFISLFNSPVYSRSDDEYIVNKFSAKISYSYRPKIRNIQSFVLNFENTRISGTILKLNPKYWGNKDTVRMGIGFNYMYSSDQRDNKQYPLEGYFIQGEFRGYTNHDLSVRYGQIRTNLQYYYPLTKKWNVSTNLSAGISKKNIEAYIFDKAIGYDNVYLRGYEYYVNDGQHYITFNSTIKYNILPTVVTVINFLPFLPKFNKIHFTIYGKAFFDMGYSYHAYPQFSNFMNNKFLCSGGIGLDIISYYDINLSIDYSFNQLKEHGFFFTIKSILF